MRRTARAKPPGSRKPVGRARAGGAVPFWVFLATSLSVPLLSAPGRRIGGRADRGGHPLRRRPPADRQLDYPGRDPGHRDQRRPHHPHPVSTPGTTDSCKRRTFTPASFPLHVVGIAYADEGTGVSGAASGAPDFGNETIVAGWLRFLAPARSVCDTPDYVQRQFPSIHPCTRHEDSRAVLPASTCPSAQGYLPTPK